jgi:hypothetical protein
MAKGSITLKSWVENYTSSDVPNIKNIWQPTGTFYVD